MATSVSQMPRSRLVSRWWLWVAILAVLPYLNALPGDFVFDDVVIRDNPSITGPQASVLGLLTEQYRPGIGLYRPVTMLSYLANARLSGDAFGYHLVNILLHAVVSVQVYLLSRRFIPGLGSFLAAALFAVHPIHTEVVANIVGRAELLSAMLSLACLLSVARASEPSAQRFPWTGLGLLAYALAGLSKESAFTTIVLVPCVAWWVERPLAPWNALRRAIPYLFVAAICLVLRQAVLGSFTLPELVDPMSNPLLDVGTLPRIATALVILQRYVSLLTFPIVLSADYSYNQVPVIESVADAELIASLGLGVGVAACCWRARHRSPVLVVAVLFLLAPLALTANLLFPIGTIMAERFLYLPSVGWCVGAGYIADVAVRRSAKAFPLVGIALLLLGGRTVCRNRDWQSEFALWSATTVTSPNSSKAHFNLAIELAKRGDFDGALREHSRALSIYPRIAAAHYEMGIIHYRMGDLAKAEAAFRAELQLNQENLQPLLGLGYVHLARGDRVAAEQCITTAASRIRGEDPGIQKMFEKLLEMFEARAPQPVPE